jgi:hypothetical protein
LRGFRAYNRFEQQRGLSDVDSRESLGQHTVVVIFELSLPTLEPQQDLLRLAGGKSVVPQARYDGDLPQDAAPALMDMPQSHPKFALALDGHFRFAG